MKSFLHRSLQFLVVLSLVLLLTSLVRADSTETLLTNILVNMPLQTRMPALSGYVFSGQKPDQTSPLANVMVELYGSNEGGDPGTLIARTNTDTYGAYSLVVSRTFEYYKIMQIDLSGYVSVGADSEDGTVVNNGLIQYLHPLTDKTLINNNFWDRAIQSQESDLVITDLWFSEGSFCYQIRNVGKAMVPAGHISTLTIDGVEVEQDMVNVDLSPGQRAMRCFDYEWQCQGEQDAIIIKADATNIVEEADEQNNIREEAWKCLDKELPVILTGPDVSNVTSTSAVITWTTNTKCNSVVKFGRKAGFFGQGRAVPALALEHHISLDELQPSSVYYGFVESEDSLGNIVRSKHFYFKTLAQSDNQKPSLSMKDTGPCHGIVVIDANATDNIAVNKVEFFIQGEPLVTDFSPPFKCAIDTNDYSNGEYLLRAKATDLAGNSQETEVTLNVDNPLPDVIDPTIYFISPQNGESVDRGTISISVHAHDETPNQEGSTMVKRVQFYIDDVYRSTAFVRGQQLQFTFTHSWNTMAYSSGDHILKAVAYDEAGNSATASITVTIPAPIPMEIGPVIEVTRLELSRDGAVYNTGLLVENTGLAMAREIEVIDHLAGFQAVYSNLGDCYIDYDASNRESIVIPGSHLLLDPGESKEYWYQFVPVLYEDEMNYEIGSVTELSYMDSGGQTYSRELTIPETGDMELEEAFASASYLIVTNPGRLFCEYEHKDVNSLLITMAKLAREKSGVLGYMDTYDAQILLSLYKPGGDWAGRLFSGWEAGGGYLLLVGENEIIPAQPASQVLASDNWYADFTGSDSRPELVVGRIIGNSAARMEEPIEISLSTSFSGDDVLVIAGTGTGVDNFENTADDVTDIFEEFCHVRKIYWSDYNNDNERFNDLKTLTKKRDIIFYKGHGDTDGWDSVFEASDVWELDMDGHHPIVFAGSCYTGYYEDHPDPDISEGDYGMAEAFLNYDAPVYIGASDWSPRLVGSEAFEDYFDYWTSYHVNTGTALRHIKKDLIDEGGCYKRRFVQEYNLYGDPKYGVFAGAQAQQLFLTKMMSSVSPPPETINLQIPDCNVTQVEDTDIVTIPGGSYILLPDVPQIPMYVYKCDYDSRYKIQDVTLTDRSGLSTLTGIHLPIEGMQGGPNTDEDMPVVDWTASEWYPDTDFDWATYDNGDGTHTLVIRVHAFFYNHLTTDCRFYNSFSFNVTYTESQVQINSLLTNYIQDDKVNVHTELTNMGEAADVICEAVVRKYVADDVIDGLMLKTLEDFTGDATFDLLWNIASVYPGQYYIDVCLRNISGLLLDRKTQNFTIIENTQY